MYVVSSAEGREWLHVVHHWTYRHPYRNRTKLLVHGIALSSASLFFDLSPPHHSVYKVFRVLVDSVLRNATFSGQVVGITTMEVLERKTL